MEKKTTFENAACLLFTIHGWDNSKEGDKSKVDTNADKSMIAVKKLLTDPKGPLQDLKSFMYTTVRTNYIKRNSVPSYRAKGLYLFNINSVEEVDAKLTAFKKELPKYVDAWLKVYPQKVEDALARLNDQGNRNDYPTIEEMKNRFWFEWEWVDFGVARNLPETMRKREQAKAEKKWAESSEMIVQALRYSFKEMIDHASSLLKVKKDGTRVGFKDSSFDKITEFCETFRNRNLCNDAELENLVNTAQKVLTGVESPQDLKTDGKLRRAVAKNFREINDTLEKMVVIKPTRKFNFDAD